MQLVSQEAGRLATLVNDRVRYKTDIWAREFAAARPFRHVVIDDFLERGFCQWLMQEFPVFDSAQAVNELGYAGRKAVHSEVAKIGPAYREFDHLVRDREFLDWVGAIAGMPSLLHDPDYVGAGTHENLDGQELDAHIDFNYHPYRHWHRRLNLIVFLNEEWEGEWGGSLELLKDPWEADCKGMRMVLPIANRAVLFETTESSWHGFSRVHLPDDKKHLSRQSLAVYFYSRERPAEETAPSHGTVYVPRALPDRFRPGYTFSQQDADELAALIERRDAQIRFLYRRELEMSEMLFGVTRSMSFRAGRWVTWPWRTLRGK